MAVEKQAKKRRTAESAKMADEKPVPEEAHDEVIEAEESPSMIDVPAFAQRTSGVVNKNKQRCLILGTRRMSKRERHFLHDFQNLIPHSMLSSKVTVQKSLVNLMKDLVDLHSCNTSIFLNAKKNGTVLWAGQGVEGPSVSFVLKNLSTASELKMRGNCLKYSRPLLHFDKEFQEFAHLRVIQSLFNMIFGTPKDHPKAKPFFDHMFCFFYYDGHIWFRNYQISTEGKADVDLAEIGPRFCLSPVALIDGFFQGECIWKNPRPSQTDISMSKKAEKASQYIAKKEAKMRKKHREQAFPMLPSEEDMLFGQ